MVACCERPDRRAFRRLEDAQACLLVDELRRHVVAPDLLEPHVRGEVADVADGSIEALRRDPQHERSRSIVVRRRGDDEPAVLLGDEGEVTDGVTELVVGNDDADPPVPDDLREILLLPSTGPGPGAIHARSVEDRLVSNASFVVRVGRRCVSDSRRLARAAVSRTARRRFLVAADRVAELCWSHGAPPSALLMSPPWARKPIAPATTRNAAATPTTLVHPRPVFFRMAPWSVARSRRAVSRAAASFRSVSSCLRYSISVFMTPSPVAGCRPFSCRTSASRRRPRLTRCRAFSSVHESARATSG